MLHPVPLTSYAFRYDNWGANPSATPGTSITPGATNAEGTFTQIASSANIAQDCYWLHLQVSGGATSTAAKNQLLDVGVDPAGGTSYVAVISNLQIGASPLLTAAGVREYLFPIFITAGSSVAVRIQGSNGTAGTVRVAAAWWGQPSRPELAPRGFLAQTFGTITNSSGQSITPGNAADGTWISLGTTTTALWWWQLGYAVDNGTITAEYTYFELAYGDGTNKHTIFRYMHGGTTGEVCGAFLQTHLTPCGGYCPVPAGETIYARARCNNAPDTGYHVTAIGIGG